MKLTHNQGVRLLQIATHIIALPLVIWAVVQGWWGWLMAVVNLLVHWHLGHQRRLSSHGGSWCV